MCIMIFLCFKLLENVCFLYFLTAFLSPREAVFGFCPTLHLYQRRTGWSLPRSSGSIFDHVGYHIITDFAEIQGLEVLAVVST